MDTTIQYINKCQGAKEIQKKQLSTGDFFYIPPYANCGTTGSLIYTDDMKEDLIGVDFVFLPRQDQLQEKLKESHSMGAMIQDLYWFYDPEHFCPETDDEYRICTCKQKGIERRTRFCSIEQLWLGVVMDEIYKKEWDGFEWFSKGCAGTLQPGISCAPESTSPQ